MARALTPQDGYAIMTLLARQATGQSSISVANMASFISAGETAMATGKENVFNALSLIIGRTMVEARAYKGKLAKMNAINTGIYTSRFRKISFYSKDPVASGWFNTNLYTNLAEGFTNGENESSGTPQSTKSQWEQHQAMPLEMNFAGTTTWQHCITMYEDQFAKALRDPVELASFVSGIMTEHGNDIEAAREAFNRMTLLSKIGATYYYDSQSLTSGQVVNLTTAYNTYFGTNYNSAALRSTYLKSFLEFMTATINQTSDFMTERSKARHLAFTKSVGGVSYSILRHTPKDKQVLYLYQPLFRMAETIVLPELFNEKRLDIETQYEPVDFWQCNTTDAERPQVKVATAFCNPSNGVQSTTGNVTLSYVVGVLADQDAMMTDFQLERANTTPLEARKGYRNTWLTFAKNAINDPTENTVIFIMDDSGVTPAADASPAADDSPAAEVSESRSVKKSSK